MVGKKSQIIWREICDEESDIKNEYEEFEEISESSLDESEISSSNSHKYQTIYDEDKWVEKTEEVVKNTRDEVEVERKRKIRDHEKRDQWEAQTQEHHKSTDPLWRYYPKQVQNILKKKRIDRERLRRSLKPPGKRNYRILFTNVKFICSEEVNKASYMVKRMKDRYYKMIHAEKRVLKALREKGLHLDRKDFNIMEVFNSEFYNLISEYDQQSESVCYKKECSEDANQFESTSSKGSEKIREKQKEMSIGSKIDNGDVSQKTNEYWNFDLASLNKSWTPISCHFEPISNHSKLTHKSRSTFVSKKSQRMLFQDYQVERREQAHAHQSQGKDCICKWNKNNLLLYYPLFEYYPYVYESEDRSETHSFGHSELLRSLSMPIAHHYLDDRIIEQLDLERQPLANLTSQSINLCSVEIATPYRPVAKISLTAGSDFFATPSWKFFNV